MTREQAIPYISTGLDDAMSAIDVELMNEAQLKSATLVGWQCGFEPMFVAVFSYLGDTQGRLDIVNAHDAEEIAADWLAERKWFSGEPTPADYVLVP